MRGAGSNDLSGNGQSSIRTHEEVGTHPPQRQPMDNTKLIRSSLTRMLLHSTSRLERHPLRFKGSDSLGMPVRCAIEPMLLLRQRQ
jgi:hypothetical protein